MNRCNVETQSCSSLWLWVNDHQRQVGLNAAQLTYISLPFTPLSSDLNLLLNPHSQLIHTSYSAEKTEVTKRTSINSSQVPWILPPLFEGFMPLTRPTLSLVCEMPHLSSTHSHPWALSPLLSRINLSYLTNNFHYTQIFCYFFYLWKTSLSFLNSLPFQLYPSLCFCL